jgi:hypothetical protein
MRFRLLASVATLLLAIGPAFAADVAALRQSLTLHAAFDGQFDADFVRGGDRTLHLAGGGTSGPAKESDTLKLTRDGGRFGGALHVTKKNPVRPYFKGPGVLDYKEANWSGSVSVWLRISPDEDLEPGYCDPIQIVGDSGRKGFIFLEWSKDETPRHFRYAIRPLFEIWNPNNIDWALMTDAQRPMVQIKHVPFSRTRWTHVVFTFDRINAGKAGTGTLYIDGKSQGRIENWDLTFGWQADKVQLVLAAAYVGHMDDLAVFDRALTDREVMQVFTLRNGIADLR